MNPDEAIAAIRTQGGTDADVEAYLRSIGAQEVDPNDPNEILRRMNVQKDLSARKSARLAANARDKKLSGLDALGAIAQTWSDASTFGLSGLLDDAVTAAVGPSTFRGNRDARQTAREGLSGYDRTLATIGGAVSNPVGTVARVLKPGASIAARLAIGAPRAGSGVIKTGLAGAREGATQGALTGFGENVGTSDDVTGLKAAADGAVAGGLLGGVIPAGIRLAERTGTLARVGFARPLDEVAFDMQDAMRAADDQLYAAVRREAGASGTTPAIRDVLESQTVKPFAAMIRRSETFAGANDATVLTEAYKLMSNAQRRAAKSIEGTPEFLADLELKTSDIGKAKGRMLDAATTEGTVTIPGRARSAPPPTTAQSPAPTVREAIDNMRTRSAKVVTRGEGTVMQQRAREALERHDTENIVSPSLLGQAQPQRVVTPGTTQTIPAGLPTFPQAVATHARAAGELEAFTNTADAVRNVLYGKSVKGKKLLIESPEALRREIAKMTPGEAEAALKAALGRSREVVRLSANPIGDFGVRPSLFRAASTPHKIDPFLRLLEKQAGRKPSSLLTVADEVAWRAPGLLGRTAGHNQ